MNTTLTEIPKMYETENDISQAHRSELNALMNQRLADAVDLHIRNNHKHLTTMKACLPSERQNSLAAQKTAPAQEQN
jgi:ferritin-like metal-binding protein YciE